MHGEGNSAGCAAEVVDVVGERLADVSFVGGGGVEVELFDASFVGVELEFVAGVEVELVGFFFETGGGAASGADEDIVVELAIEEERAAGAGGVVSAGGALDEPVEGGEVGGQVRVLDHGAEVLGRLAGIGVGWVAGDEAAEGGGFDAPAEHVAGGEAVERDGDCVDFVAGGFVGGLAVVGHDERDEFGGVVGADEGMDGGDWAGVAPAKDGGGEDERGVGGGECR